MIVSLHRSFRYLTPKLPLDQHALNGDLLGSKSFHLICSPTRCIDVVTGLLSRRVEVQRCRSEPRQDSLFVWEPVPDSCVPGELANCYRACKYVDIVSPNHHELGGFFGYKSDEGPDDEINRHFIEQWCQKWLEEGVGKEGQGAIIVRAGKGGCYLSSRKHSKWLPAYHRTDDDGNDRHKVVDPTGGGNAFLGALALALARGTDLEEAAIRASVAASFAIEQIGVPELAHQHDNETWNGVQVDARLSDFKQRLAKQA